MWKLRAEAERWEPLAGVPWRDMPDAEFAAVSAAYDAGFSPEQAGSLERWFAHEGDGAHPSPLPEGEGISEEGS